MPPERTGAFVRGLRSASVSRNSPFNQARPISHVRVHLSLNMTTVLTVLPSPDGCATVFKVHTYAGRSWVSVTTTHHLSFAA